MRRTLLEKYLEPLFERFKKEIYQGEICYARETFREILDRSSDIRWERKSVRTYITPIPLSDIPDILDIIDEWRR